jgi:hypothetical protein
MTKHTSTHRYSLAVLEELLNSERMLRKQAEDMYSEMRQAVVKLGYALAPMLLDGMAKESPTRIEETPAMELMELIKQDVKADRMDLQTRLRRLERKYQAEQAENEQLGAIKERLEAEVEVLKDRSARQPAKQSTAAPLPPDHEVESAFGSDRLAADLAGPESVTAYPTESQARSTGADAVFEPYAEPELWPAWFSEWCDQPTFATDRQLIRLLGTTGEPLRSVLKTELADVLGHQRAGGAEWRAIRRAQEPWGLVHTIEAQRGRITPHLIHLTEKGEMAYRLLYGAQPAPQQAPQLLRRHSSPDHVYLILETQQILERAGFTVEQDFDPISVSDGDYDPDLIASYESKTLFVEAERDTRKDPAARRQKWAKAIEASGGELYLAVGTQKAVDPLFSELAFIVGKLHQEVQVYGLITEELARAERVQGWDVFTLERRLP